MVVVMFFGDHDWLGWTPKQRILFKIRETKQAHSIAAQCYLDCYKLSEANLDSLLVHGNVLLDESNTHSNPKKYIIQSPKEDSTQVKLTLNVSDSLSYLMRVDGVQEDRKCPC